VLGIEPAAQLLPKLPKPGGVPHREQPFFLCRAVAIPAATKGTTGRESLAGNKIVLAHVPT